MQHAGTVVLATYAFENTRLLLLSRDRFSRALARQRDGRGGPAHDHGGEERSASGRTAVLNDGFCFNYGAAVTNAHSGALLSGLKYGIKPLVHGVTYDL